MKKVHVYSHTHWDYEWYFTANESIIQLIYHMDEVMDALEERLVDNYLLDGQMILLEEYLRFSPSNFDRVKKLVEEKKLILGPWYTQTDELIIDGESIVRNLFYGIKAAEKFGEYMKVAYLPDSFGQTKDLPKIMNGFDIKRSIFWRGVSKDNCKNREFLWKGEDGSSLLVYNIKNGYFYGGNLIYSDDVETVENTILDGSSKENILLPVGGDQRYVDFNIKERIDFYKNKSKHDLEYVESSCEKFFDELEREGNFEEVLGEFVNPSNSKIHRSIYSSRYDHKYLNDKVERMLIYKLEPLMVIAENLGLDPKIEMIEAIWKRLLMNHAHDSACGCNSDKTNRSILNRLIEADELAYSAHDYIIRKISESLKGKKENDLILINTLPKKRKVNSEITLSTKFKEFKIVDKNGNLVDYQILDTKKEYSGSIKKDEKDYDENLYYYISKISVNEEIEGLGIKRFQVVKDENLEVKEIEILNSNEIEDDLFKVSLMEGKINIFDKKRNVILEDCVYIEDSGDDGDTYDYSPPEKDFLLKFRFENSKVSAIKGNIYNELKIEGKLEIPKDLNSREDKTLDTSIDYELKISLNNSKNIEFHLEIDNKANDHRMRIVIDTGLRSKYSIADTAFGVIERDNKPEHLDDWRELLWKEEPSPIYPMLHFVGLKDEKYNAYIFNKGIKEYEVLDDSQIALTLFRSVGYLGKPDLIRRPGVASGNEFKYIKTPDSQLIKRMKFKFALYLGKIIDLNEVSERWKDYAIKVSDYQVQEINRFTNTLKYFVMHPLREEINFMDNLIDVSNMKNIRITSIAPIDKRSYFIRFVNNGEEIADSGEIFIGNCKNYQWINMNNKGKFNKIENEGYINLGSFRKGEIKTLKINF